MGSDDVEGDVPGAAIRPLTRRPGCHWFGYYDKFQTDPSDRYALAMRVDFEHRLPGPGDAVAIGMVDLADGDRWIDLATSRAWSWQQGCMLQWIPGSDREVIFNDRDGDRYVARVLDVFSGAQRTLPRPVGTLSPDGRTALCEDYRRIWDFRAGYGYPGIPDPHRDDPAPTGIGVWSMNLASGESRLLVSVADLAAVPYPGLRPDHRHYINHLAWNPSGTRFLCFHRWDGERQPTRVFTMNADGEDRRLLSAHGASHWTWRDDAHVLIWGEGAYRLFRDDDRGEAIETVWEAPNGHQTYLPDTDDEWLLTDTYPLGEERVQTVCCRHLPSGRTVVLGRFPSPPEYTGQWRCDTHPRLTRCGRRVIVDSPHGGDGRQMYLLDLGDLIDSG